MGVFGKIWKAITDGAPYSGNKQANREIFSLIWDCEHMDVSYRRTRRLVDEVIKKAQTAAEAERALFILDDAHRDSLERLDQSYMKAGERSFRCSKSSWRKLLEELGYFKPQFEYYPDSAKLRIWGKDRRGCSYFFRVTPVSKAGSVCNPSVWFYNCALEGLAKAASSMRSMDKEEVVSALIDVGFSDVVVKRADEVSFAAAVTYHGSKNAFELDARVRIEDTRAPSAERQALVGIADGNRLHERPDFDQMDGCEFEEFCAGLLRKNGFEDVEVTAGSGDQGVDVLATRDRIRYGIQCKCYGEDVGNKAVQEAYAGKTFYGCHVAVVLTNRGFTGPAVDLALRTGVVLWDRAELLRLVRNGEDGRS